MNPAQKNAIELLLWVAVIISVFVILLLNDITGWSYLWCLLIVMISGHKIRSHWSNI